MSAANGPTRHPAGQQEDAAGPAPRPLAGGGHNSPVRIRQAAGPADMAAVRECFRVYTEWLDEDISFQDYAAEVDGLPGKYAPPSGALLLAVDASDDRVLGCVAVRPIQLGPDYLGHRKAGARLCEMKRLFVYPEARGRRVASALVREAIALGQKAGYSEMVLDTIARMQPAIRLYESEGFVTTKPYYFNPLPAVVYFTRDLYPPGGSTDLS